MPACPAAEAPAFPSIVTACRTSDRPARLPERDQDAGGDDRHGHAERNRRVELGDDLVPEDLGADEDQDDGERVLQVFEPVNHGREREIERAQSEDRHDVGGEHDVGVGRDGKDRRHRIDGEDEVGDVDHDEGQEQRCREQGEFACLRIGLADEESRAVQLRRNPHPPGQQAHQRVICHVLLALAHDQHLHAGGDQEGAEEIQHPLVLLDQRRTDRDHDAAQDQHGQNTPE